MRLRGLTFLLLGFYLAGCSGHGEPSGNSDGNIHGRAFALANAKIRVSATDDDGKTFYTLCEATADANGKFQCTADPGDYDTFGPIVVFATDSSGNELRSMIADYPADGSIIIAVSRLSDIATARALLLSSQGAAIDSALDAADAEVRLAAGLGSNSIFAVGSEADSAVRRDFASRLRTLIPDYAVHRALANDFAANRAFTGANAPLWMSLGGNVTATPAAVPIAFTITGPVIAISGAFELTWSSALVASYQVIVCSTASPSAPDCRTFNSATTSLAFAGGELASGNYYVWVRSPDGRDASNSTPSLPYSFRVVSQ